MVLILTMHKTVAVSALIRRHRPFCYCKLLATLENALFAFPPIKRSVPMTGTRITASITAYSAMS